MKEVLIDDCVVWQADPAGDNSDTWFEGGSLEGPLDLTNVLKNRTTATLTIRLRTVKDFSGPAIDVSFDRISATGLKIKDPGFETGKGWRVMDSGGGLISGIDRYDSKLHRHVFDTVSKLYGEFYR